jgi:ribosomal protein L39E
VLVEEYKQRFEVLKERSVPFHVGMRKKRNVAYKKKRRRMREDNPKTELEFLGAMT